MVTLGEIDTPAAVVDRGIVTRNVARMRDHLAGLRVSLRPHVKTAKSRPVTAMMVEGQPGELMSQEALRSINDFQRALDQHPLVMRTISLVDIMKGTMHLGGHRGRANDSFSIETWSQRAKRVDKEQFLSKLISPDHSRARITVLSKASSTQDTRTLMDDLRRTSERFFNDGLRGHVTGSTAVHTKAIGRLLNRLEELRLMV